MSTYGCMRIFHKLLSHTSCKEAEKKLSNADHTSMQFATTYNCHPCSGTFLFCFVYRYLKKKPDNLTITGASSFDALNQQRKRSTGDATANAAVLSENHLAVPVSPNTPLLGQNRSMGHSIKHGFQNKLVFGACDFCQKHVMRQGKVCKFCK